MSTFSVTPGVPGEPSAADLSAGSQKGGADSDPCGVASAGGVAQLEVAASGVDALDRASASDPGTTGSRQPEQEELHPSPAPTPHHSPPLEPRAESPRPPATTDSARGGSLEGSGSRALALLTELAREIEDLEAKTAAEDALDAIAVLCGCPQWDYPGQIVRDVQMLVRQIAVRDTVIAERDATIAQIRKLLGGEG